MNLQQGFDMFIMSREEYCSIKTVNNYKNTLGYFTAFMSERRNMPLEEIDINTIVKEDLSAYTIYLRNKPKYTNHPFNKEDKKGITKRTIKTYQTDMRTFFNYLYDEEYIQNDVMRKFKMIKPETKQIIPLTEDDVKIIDGLYDSKDTIGLRNLCMVHLMLDAGLRRSEVIDLKLSHVNFKQNFIHVVDGKGSKDRIVPLSRRLKKMLFTYKTVYRPDCEHDYFLCNRNGEQLTEDCIKMIFARMKKHTTLSRLYPHLLRHTFATAYVIQGGDLESLRIYMGHTSLDITQKYLHLANQFGFNTDIYKLDERFFKRK